MSVYASFIGGAIGIVLLALLSVPVAQAALAFGPTEMTALMCFALSLVTVLGGRNIIKGFTALFLGMWIGMIGLDPIAGPTRYTFGFVDLFDGIDFTVVAVGLYGLSEMFVSLSQQTTGRLADYNFRSLLPNFQDLLICKWVLLWSSLTAFFVGVVPGSARRRRRCLPTRRRRNTHGRPTNSAPGPSRAWRRLRRQTTARPMRR